MSAIELRGDLNNYTLGSPRAVWSARGDRILRYTIDIRHKVLHLHREISAAELFILEDKLNTLIASWDARNAQHQVKSMFRDGRSAAEEATAQAKRQLESLKTILLKTLSVNDVVDWEGLKHKEAYPAPEPYPEPKPRLSEEASPRFVEPKIGFFDLLFGKRASLIEQARAHHRGMVGAVEQRNIQHRNAHAEAVKSWESRKKSYLNAHAERERAFLLEQGEQNGLIDDLRAGVERGDPTAVIEHATLVLEKSEYDGLFEKSYRVQYDSDHKLLSIEYRLPNPEELPRVKSVKFDKATGELIDSYISDRDAKANFESALYQVSLRTLHELFESDELGNIQQILYNGLVEFVDKRTGKEARSCVMSILVNRETFTDIELSRVDPKTCFKTLKGVSAATLSSLTPIPPVMELNREDSRFVDGRAIVEELDHTQNLASMSWEDFEHLVRELFEREFASRGGEVKITQASRDGGVDAIAFDPDPITGGKIVIQAKRYTRTVGVSAVRDLFGTVMNEGASKGILVTTADYGPDAHQFAAGKPLSLLSGSHLLYMLERHGFKAKIDLREARDAAMRA
jgi:restriction system protein